MEDAPDNCAGTDDGRLPIGKSETNLGKRRAVANRSKAPCDTVLHCVARRYGIGQLCKNGATRLSVADWALLLLPRAGSLNTLGKTITVYLNGDDVGIKSLLKKLSALKRMGNPYIDRSESEIAKMLLLLVAPREYRRITGRAKRAKTGRKAS